MPRRARLDAPGSLHHVIIRGINKRKIVNDVTDRKNFAKRISALAAGTKTSIYAWALMTNHHILLRSAEVLKWFGKKEGEAKKNYRNYVKKGIDEGRRPELVGGGLFRSLGGWSAVKALRRSGDRELSDDRILGSGKFVARIIKEAEAHIRYQFPAKDDPEKINEFIAKICKNDSISITTYPISHTAE